MRPSPLGLNASDETDDCRVPIELKGSSMPPTWRSASKDSQDRNGSTRAPVSDTCIVSDETMQYAELEKALVVVAREGSRNIALAREIADWLERRLALAERRTRPE